MIMAKHLMYSKDKSKFEHNTSSSVKWEIRKHNLDFGGFIEACILKFGGN